MKVKNDCGRRTCTYCRQTCSPCSGRHRRLKVANSSVVTVGRRRESSAGPRTPEREDGTLGKGGFTRSNPAVSIGCHERRSTAGVERHCNDNRQSTPDQRTGRKVPPRAMLFDASARDVKHHSKFQPAIPEEAQLGIFSQKKLKAQSVNSIVENLFMHVGFSRKAPREINQTCISHQYIGRINNV